ncbi:hypothetical protein P153DRAFT_16780 [Dothidotthia symphoricarpi CBS 119687]|uniref:Uncharacterized protein n=1 Tax=Dothidotthia symphoricarpi CBS 119687 TaxID=1392245 RepID=A0A6A6ABG3_9PLEO|nr:uncharacterized protein P153DRAFT_16780 [Dothidotthia symphoricarpi CBS 119687]KAF2129282.1 hypothetical protein P153DRAFT_16780 [Dothidotthia symphoricarpi CBS 119687]
MLLKRNRCVRDLTLWTPLKYGRLVSVKFIAMPAPHVNRIREVFMGLCILRESMIALFWKFLSMMMIVFLSHIVFTTWLTLHNFPTICHLQRTISSRFCDLQSSTNDDHIFLTIVLYTNPWDYPYSYFPW